MTAIYRVENPKTMQGLWYDKDANLNPFITKLTDAKSGHLPMAPDPTYSEGGTAWYSGCISFEQMREWFSFRDLVELGLAGYRLYKFEATRYRKVPGHVIFTRESAVIAARMDIDILKGDD